MNKKKFYLFFAMFGSLYIHQYFWVLTGSQSSIVEGQEVRRKNLWEEITESGSHNFLLKLSWRLLMGEQDLSLYDLSKIPLWHVHVFVSGIFYSPSTTFHICFLYSPGPIPAVLAYRMGIWSNPLKNSLIQLTFKIIFFVEKFSVILWV